jgi:pimeloyl-ACP methyl ester carboxylesterase
MIPEIRNAQGERLDHTFHAGAPDCKEILVIGHGVTGNKDRPALVALSKAAAAIGLPSLRISFAGNGDSEGCFEDSTISKEVEDLGSVLDALDGWKIGYVGHSMGGAVGVLRAASDPRIKTLVSLAGMVNTADFLERKFGALTPGEGFMWDKPECPLSQSYADDMRSIDTVLPQAADIGIPWLLVHGSSDEVVLPRDSQAALAANNGRTQLLELEGADHVFSNESTAAMTTGVINWLQNR